MPTNLAIDDKLIVEAQRLGAHKSKKDAVTEALTQYIRRHKQQQVLASFGTVDFEPGYDHKAGRKRR